MTVAPQDMEKPRLARGGNILLRKTGDFLTVGASTFGGVITIGLLALLAAVLIHGAWPAMEKFGLKFIWGKWDVGMGEEGDQFYRAESYGAMSAIFGTFITSFIALAIAVPVSLGAAIFLVRIAPRAARWTGKGWAMWIVEGCSFMIELLAAIPSIVYGFWGIIVLKPILLPFCNWITSLFEGKHWFLVDQAGKNQFFFPEHSFKGTPDGGGLLAAGIVLAIMIIPIITAITRDVLRVVPKDLEQGAIGLGATWWQATKVVLSFAKGGIFGAIALGLARAIGETMAVTMVLPMSDRLDFNIVGSGSTMASRLATSYGTPKSELMTESLTYLALILLGVTLIVNLLSRLLVRQFMKQGGGGKKK